MTTIKQIERELLKRIAAMSPEEVKAFATEYNEKRKAALGIPQVSTK